MHKESIIDSIVGMYTQLTPVTKEIIDSCGAEVVFCPCTGIDHIKAPKVIYLDDEWKCTEGLKVTSTAEHTWSLILQLAKMKRMQLYGKTLGIIGYGRIGQMVKKYANVFGMETFVCDKESGFYYKFILNDCDAITLHVPLNEETCGMIGKNEFDMMKDGALLVNTSRPDIVDKEALINALYNFKIGGYADDFADTRYINAIAGVSLIQTGHIAGNTKESREATDIYIANKIVQYIRGLSITYENVTLKGS